jgi:TM2 domain-containing membrane protein YozV
MPVYGAYWPSCWCCICSYMALTGKARQSHVFYDLLCIWKGYMLYSLNRHKLLINKHNKGLCIWYFCIWNAYMLCLLFHVKQGINALYSAIYKPLAAFSDKPAALHTSASAKAAYLVQIKPLAAFLEWRISAYLWRDFAHF